MNTENIISLDDVELKKLITIEKLTLLRYLIDEILKENQELKEDNCRLKKELDNKKTAFNEGKSAGHNRAMAFYRRT